MENSVTKREKISYGLYFMGQNVFYGLVGYMTTYFTDIGITAALVAIVALITKVWDAINDPILGMIMDKVNFKKGKFLPWLRISVIAIPVATILLFIIPTGISMMAKIIWATLAYMLWDTAYTLAMYRFWYCYHDDNRPEGTCFTKQHRKNVCYFCRYCYRNCPAVGTAAVRRLVNNSNCVISFVMCYDDSDLSVRKGESN